MKLISKKTLLLFFLPGAIFMGAFLIYPIFKMFIDSLGAIHEMQYAPKTSYTYLYVLPGKSLLPTITPIAYDDDF